MDEAPPPRWPPRRSWRRRATALNDATKDAQLARLPFVAILGVFILVVSITERAQADDPLGVGALLLVVVLVVAVVVKSLDRLVQRDEHWLQGFDGWCEASGRAGDGLVPVAGPPWPEWVGDLRALERDVQQQVQDVLRVAARETDLVVGLTRNRHVGRWPQVVVIRRLATAQRPLGLRPRPFPGWEAFTEWYLVRPEAVPAPPELQRWMTAERRRLDVALDGHWLAVWCSYGERRKATRSIRRGPQFADVVAGLLRSSEELATALDGHEEVAERS